MLSEVLTGDRPWWVEQGDALETLRAMPSESVHVCATSPPYWGLRDYSLPPSVWGGDPACAHEWGDAVRTPWANEMPGPSTNVPKNTAAGHQRPKETGPFCLRCGAWLGCLGLEPTPALFVTHVVELFREVKRVLRKDATLWLNLGDSYAGSWGAQSRANGTNDGSTLGGGSMLSARQIAAHPQRSGGTGSLKNTPGLKNKDLVGIPWRVAFALQDDGWWLRSAITWCKKSAMPESIRDRPSSATEMIFLLAKSERYYYDTDAVREVTGNEADPAEYATTLGRDWADYDQDAKEGRGHSVSSQRPTKRGGKALTNPAGRNLRNFWLLGPEPLGDDHYAAWPTEVPRRAILAGSSERGVCPECGNPWRRVVERNGKTAREAMYEQGEAHHARAYGGAPQGLDFKGSHWKLPQRTVETRGWEPTCAHGRDSIPALALDVFSGSGRTGIVAQRLGRRYVGIELSEYQAAKSRARIVADRGVEARHAAEVAQNAQLRLFGAA